MMDILLLAIAIFNLSSLVLREVFTPTQPVLINHHPSQVFTPSTVHTTNHAHVYTTCDKSFQYSRDHLMSVNKASNVISENVLSQLKDLGLCTCKQVHELTKKRTRRGKRGGRRKQRQIKVVTSSSPLIEKKRQSPKLFVNKTNLIDICTAEFYQEESEQLKLLYLNAQSCRNKTLRIHDLILESNSDLVFITETWFRETGDEPLINEIVPNEFNIKSVPRTSGSGGGTAIIYRNSIDIIFCETEKFNYSSFEHCQLKIKTQQGALFCASIYRPPPSKKNNHTQSAFQSEFSDFLDYINTERNVYLLGDFNLHYENTKDNAVNNFQTLLEEHDIQQLVTESTHKHHHTLDLVLTRRETSKVSNIKLHDIGLSDHHVISVELNYQKPTAKKQKVLSRNLKSINLEVFKEELSSSLSTNSLESVEDFNNCLRDVLDHHAPLRMRTLSSRPSAPWLTLRVKASKQEKRKAERQWKKSGLTVHKEIYNRNQKLTSDIVKEEKKKYFNDGIASCKSSKGLFTICNELLGKNKDPILPTNLKPNDLPDAMNAYFGTKIDRIREDLDTVPSEPEFDEFNGNSFTDFKLVTEDYVKTIILNSPKKFCELDPLPANLFIECFDILLPYVTVIINKSLESGIVPSSFKEAVVRPHLKKSSLDQNVLKNYRPVSNLPFLSKILEKVALSQINVHLSQNNLKEKFQSAYKSKHSTETALLKVQSDLLNAADVGKVSVLALLDLSAAFDTLDHGILLKRLNISFGIKGTALKWLSSYISDRQQTVVTNEHQSAPTLLRFGVPQGSVLGPILFSMYSQPVCDILIKHSFNYHLYADDTQLYKSVDVPHVISILQSLNECVSDVSSWMTSNKLKLNEDKTEVMIIGTPAKVKAANISTVELGGEQVTATEAVRNLGVIMDSNLSMDHHISHLRKTCYFQLKRISHLRPYLTTEATSRLVCSFVLSRLDYCNSLMSAIPESKLNKLQQIQNNAARLIMKVSKKDHITPTLKELHWLPVKSRIQYKIASIVVQCQNDPSFPVYLKELLKPYTPARPLRSSNKNLLLKPRSNLKNFGDRALPFQASEIWNNLPQDVQNAQSLTAFKSKLKTHLFRQAFF